MTEKKNPKEEPVTLDPSTFKSNANLSKKKEVKPVVQASNVQKRKKSMSERFTSVFISEDAGDVKSYLIFDILIPALKDTISDMIRGGIDALLYGSERPRNVNRGGTGGPKVSYQNYYDDTRSRSNRRGGYSGGGGQRVGRYDRKANHDFRDIIFSNKRDAVAVLDALVGITIDYEFATIMDLNELASLESNFTDNDYGWEDLRGARVLHVRNGYCLDLPTPIPID